MDEMGFGYEPFFRMGYAIEQMGDAFANMGESFAQGREAYWRHRAALNGLTRRQRLALWVLDAAEWLSDKILGEKRW